MAFVVDGEQVTIAEMTRRLPAYNTTQMSEALRAGCTTTAELLEYLVARELRARANQVRARRRGRRAIGDLYSTKANRG